jgi:hypothetical protein
MSVHLVGTTPLPLMSSSKSIKVPWDGQE